MFTAHVVDDILCISARYLYTTLNDAMSLFCWTVMYGANFQPCKNGMKTGINNGYYCTFSYIFKTMVTVCLVIVRITDLTYNLAHILQERLLSIITH